MITESPKNSVDEVHGSPSHPSGMGPALPGFHARCLSPARAAAHQPADRHRSSSLLARDVGEDAALRGSKMPKSTTDPPAPGAARKGSEETSFTV